ncbi:MAG: hypothetical protein [Microvirus sp.]|nr:MAG: hypothetical protein [Microvirus sp.]
MPPNLISSSPPLHSPLAYLRSLMLNMLSDISHSQPRSTHATPPSQQSQVRRPIPPQHHSHQGRQPAYRRQPWRHPPVKAKKRKPTYLLRRPAGHWNSHGRQLATSARVREARRAR